MIKQTNKEWNKIKTLEQGLNRWKMREKVYKKYKNLKNSEKIDPDDFGTVTQTL